MKINNAIDLIPPQELDKIKSRYSAKISQAMIDYGDKTFGELMQVLENYKRDMKREIQRAVRKARIVRL